MDLYDNQRGKRGGQVIDVELQGANTQPQIAFFSFDASQYSSSSTKKY